MKLQCVLSAGLFAAHALCGGHGAETASPSKDLSAVLERYKKAQRRLFLLDYDGTLTDIKPSPRDAVPSKRLLMLLEALGKKDKVVIVTGRDKKTVDAWIPAATEVYAEYGALHRRDGTWTCPSCDTSWKSRAAEVIQSYVESFPGSLLELKETVVCFHYRQCDRSLWKRLAAECRDALCKLLDGRKDIEVVEGKAVVEIKCSERSKGSVARDICSGYDFILCVGDDVADEEMFSVCKDIDHGFSVLVGQEKVDTHAKYVVESPKSLISMMEDMLVL